VPDTEQLTDNADDNLPTVVGLYILGEVSLGEAARRTDYTRWEFRQLLLDHGVQPRLGPVDMEDADHEVEAARDLE